VSIEAASVIDPAPAPAPETPPGRWSGRRVVRVAAGFIALQLALRGWIAASGYFWQDDFIAAGRAATTPLLSAEFLLYDHDGHFMPAGFLLTGVYTHLWPLQWWPMAVTLVLLQALASLAVWRLLRLLLGDRPVLLAPLLLYLFSPLTLTSYTWWMAALNSLPLQAGLAWVAGDAIKLLRTGRVRYAVSGTIVFALAMSAFEKSLVIPVVAFAVVALLLREAGDRTPLVSAALRGRYLWVGLVAVGAAWAWAYTSVVGSPAVGEDAAGTVPQAVGLVGNGVFRGLLPGLVGGPLGWAEEGHWAQPPSWLVMAASAIAALAVIWAVRRRQGAGTVWWLVAAYVAANVAALVAGRLTVMTPDVLSLSLRYFADSTLVVAIGIALVARAPVRTDFRRREVLAPTERRDVAVVAAVAFLALCLWSTATYTRLWAESSTRDYLATAQASLARSADVPMLDQAVPSEIVWALAHPNNLASRVFGPIENRPEFARTTPDLRLLDASGRMTDGRVKPLRWIQDGPLVNCGHGVSGTGTTAVPLDGPLIPWDWTIQLNYLAGDDGVLDVALDRQAVRVPVVEGPNTVYVRVTGGGDTLYLASATRGLAVCLDSGAAGTVELAGR
jgi:putative Ca2+/H+ antiporter (TMEM165/GDT1 family)